jgi:LAO/AO transport system kinase
MNDTMVDKVLAGDFRAIARLITLVENGAPEAIGLLRELYPHTGRCVSIGITGAPGAGKSTLVDRLANFYRIQEKKVGIIAVDPTSPFTGGAILGDRIRMQSRSVDDGTFIRSMATRGNLGGLSRATADVLLILDAAGFDVVLIETVGVGQDEVEIARTAQVTLVLLVPGMGDDVQAMKAGIMEIGDIFVINKADREGTQKTEQEIRAILAMNSREDDWEPPVVRTVAIRGEGTEELIGAIRRMEQFLESRHRQGRFAQRSTQEKLLQLSRDRLFQDFLESSGFADSLPELAEKVMDKSADPYSIIESFIKRYKGKGEV